MTEQEGYYELSALMQRQAEVLEKIADSRLTSVDKVSDIEDVKQVLRQVDMLFDFTLGDVNVLAAALESLASRIEGEDGLIAVAQSIQANVANTRGLLDQTFGRSELPE